MKKITQWEHFVKNCLPVAILLIAMSFIAFWTVDEPKYVWLFPLFLALVVLPIGNYFSWKKKPK